MRFDFVRNARTSGRSGLVTAIGLVLAFGAACSGTKERGHNRSPVFDTGVGATIIEPGQGAPPMPDPFGYGGYGGYPQGAQPGPPQGAYPPGQAPPSAGATPGYPVGQGTAGAAPPGYPQPGYPPPGWRRGPALTSIGGASTIDTRRETDESKIGDAAKKHPIMTPLGAAAWPVRKISGKSSSRGTSTEHGNSGPSAAPPPPPPHEAQLAYEQAQLEAMERALAERGALAGTNPAELPAVAAQPSSEPSAGGLTIAQELAALRHRQAPPPPQATGAAPTRWQTQAAAPPPPAPAAVQRPSAYDRNHDGRPDHWVEPLANGERRELFDENGDGRPERSERRDAGGQVVETREDLDGDGSFDAVTEYRGGAAYVRQADENGDGYPDAWTFYRGADVARLERDTDGDGYRDQIDFFTAGQLDRRTEDLDGDGRPERITRFDERGRPREREEDQNGDGAMDVRSFYESGRLVRRVLLNEDVAVQ